MERSTVASARAAPSQRDQGFSLIELLVATVAGALVLAAASALIAALVMGLLNLFVRPVLVVLSLPITLLTLGLFMFIINALMFWMAAEVLEGFQVTNFSHALMGSVLYSLMGIVIDSALERLFPARHP